MKRLLAFICILAIFLMGVCGPFAMADGASFAEMQKGSKGDDVKQLQEALIGQGFLSGKADGDFGKMTESAVSDFQAANGLKATGVADGDTIELLNALETERKENIVLTNGDSGADVSAVQERLIQLGYIFGKASGKFDDELETAVKMFQRRNGLEQTGTVDKVVQAALYAEDVVEASRANVVVPQKVKVNMQYSYPYLHVDFKNNGADKVDSVDIRFKLYNTYGERKQYYDNIYSFDYEENETTYQFSGTIKAGGTTTMSRNQEMSLGAFRSNDGEKLELLKVAVSRYHTENGDTYEIPESEWIWYGSDGSVEVGETNPGLPAGEMTPELREITDKIELGFKDWATFRDYLAEEYGLPWGGMIVNDYVDDGVLRDIGVEQYTVITDVDGYAVYTKDDLVYAIGAGADDGSVEVTFYKDGEEHRESINTTWYVGGISEALQQEEPEDEAAPDGAQEAEHSAESENEVGEDETTEAPAHESQSKVVDIPAGRYTVGEDIPAGDYRVAIKSGTDYLTVWGAAYDDYDTAGGQLYDYRLSTETNPEAGKITLKDGNVVDLPSTMEFEKYSGIEYSGAGEGIVPCGVYIVGEDIAAGAYSVRIHEDYCRLIVWDTYAKFEADDYASLNIGLDDEPNPDYGKLVLEDGNVVSLSTRLTFRAYSGIDFAETGANVVPAGRYIVGEDIPVGTYSVALEKGSTHFSVWGSAYEDDSDGGELVSIRLATDDETNIGKVTLEEGNVVDFSVPLVFEPYAGFAF